MFSIEVLTICYRVRGSFHYHSEVIWTNMCYGGQSRSMRIEWHILENRGRPGAITVVAPVAR